MNIGFEDFEDTLGRVQAKLDAAEAHISELKEAVTPQIIDWCKCGMATNGRLDQSGPRKTFENLLIVLDQTPAQSLAKVQADAVRLAADSVDGISTIKYYDLIDYANTLENKPS